MPRRPVEAPDDLQGLVPVRQRPCDRCEQYEATRFGVAQVVEGERGAVWRNVGLCARCAAVCAAPYGPRSALGAEHVLTTK